jgi:flagellar motor switch protein FliG
MRRLTDLDDMDPEILFEVEQGLQERIARQITGQRRRAAGVSALAQILKSADQRVEHQLRASLLQHAPQVVQKLPAPARTHTFEDLASWDGPALRRLLAAADQQTITLALAGAQNSLVDHFLAHLPAPEADELRLAWKRLGPTPLSDIEAAQEQLASLADQLTVEGAHEPALA